jgi:membrane protein DedA with SNARE-associated domain
VVIAVALGGMIGDQLLYLLGRRFGGAFCAVSPARKRGSGKRSA